MFNFTLAESPRGLRITRGLTNLTSQSVPINRIQGVQDQPAAALEAARLVPGRRRRRSATAHSRRREQRDPARPACCSRWRPGPRSTLALSRAPARIRSRRDRAAPRPRAGPLAALVRLSGRCATAGTTGRDHRARLDDPRPRHRAARQDPVGPHRAGPAAAAARGWPTCTSIHPRDR